LCANQAGAWRGSVGAGTVRLGEFGRRLGEKAAEW